MYNLKKTDLAPARWIWFPSGRTLANTFVLFRKEVYLNEIPMAATGMITADSRYCLTVNGRRVQWGPAPCDPRFLEADPVEITEYLQKGDNVIAVEVLFYGHGDGTWVAGKPGLIYKFEIQMASGTIEVVSDHTVSCLINRGRRPGQYKRWFLRALQEEYDARLYPEGWDGTAFQKDERWTGAMELDCPSDKPVICGSYPDYLYDSGCTNPQEACLLERRISRMQEIILQADCPVRTGWVRWKRDFDDWFQFRTPGSFEIEEVKLEEVSGKGWILPAVQGMNGVFATFELPEQGVGFPRFSIEAPEGTIIELITQESHDPRKTLWLDSYYFTWSRFTCREGINHFQCFDYDSVKWIQLHIHHASRPVYIWDVGIRRRVYDFAKHPDVQIGNQKLDRLMKACINALHNSAQESIVDGVGRERQQYSGDCGHQLEPLMAVFGETKLVGRFITTYSTGFLKTGYFMDCWPAYDRTVRLVQKELDMSAWGVIIDHSIQFVFDCWNYYLYTEDISLVSSVYSKFKALTAYLESIRDNEGLLMVENLPSTYVWLDHDAYRAQRHKQCAFNLYVAAMLKNPMARFAELFEKDSAGINYEALAEDILEAVREKFWCIKRNVYVANLPWEAEEGTRFCDRSLAMAVQYDLCPGGQTEECLRLLAQYPEELGISYPPNAIWRHRALIRHGYGKAVIQEWENIWAQFSSVINNNTMQEFWQVETDSFWQYSHVSIAPISLLCTEIAGIRPLEPGFSRCVIAPRLEGMGDFSVVVQTLQGPIHFEAIQEETGFQVSVQVPNGVSGIMAVNGESRPLISGSTQSCFVFH